MTHWRGPPLPVPGKLGAYEAKGGKLWDAREDDNVLYLGAAHGVTARYVAAQVPRGLVIAVEKSPVASLGLLEAASDHANLIPFVGDAARPQTYAPVVPRLGLLYQDVSQRDQVAIFLRNARAFRPRRGLLAVKARSIAVEKPPREVFEAACTELQQAGAEVVDVALLDPFHKDHAMIVTDFRPDG